MIAANFVGVDRLRSILRRCRHFRALLLLGTACGGGDSPNAPAPSASGGALTSQPAQLRALSVGVTVRALITSGDALPGGPLAFPPAPSGVGLLLDQGHTTLFVAHDLSAAGITSTNSGPPFQYARVARLWLDPTTGGLLQGALDEDGRHQFERFVSGTAGLIYGPTGFTLSAFVSGEAAGPTSNGAFGVGFTTTGLQRRMWEMGAITHAGFVILPARLFTEYAALILDGTVGASEVYLYARVLGSDSLFVLRPAAGGGATTLHAASLAQGGAVALAWVPLPDQPDTIGTPPGPARFAQFQLQADSVGALPFVRLADGVLDRSSVDPSTQTRRAGIRPSVYLVDRGDPGVMGRVAGIVNASCAGVCDPYGSLYRLELDSLRASRPPRLTRVMASGGPQSGWASPATLASTFLTLLIGEAPSHPAFDGTRAAGIWSGSLAFGQQPTTFTRIAETTQASLIPGATGSCVAALNQCWDIGDITEAESLLGAGKWIVTIRAHTLPFRATGFDYPRESGQVLLLTTP